MCPLHIHVHVQKILLEKLYRDCWQFHCIQQAWTPSTGSKNTLKIITKSEGNLGLADTKSF